MAWFWFQRAGTERTCGLDREGVFLSPHNPDILYHIWGQRIFPSRFFNAHAFSLCFTHPPLPGAGHWAWTPVCCKMGCTCGASWFLVSFPDLEPEQPFSLLPSTCCALNGTCYVYILRKCGLNCTGRNPGYYKTPLPFSPKSEMFSDRNFTPRSFGWGFLFLSMLFS